MKKEVDIFLILCLKPLQVKKAISYHLLRLLSRLKAGLQTEQHIFGQPVIMPASGV